MARFSIIWDKVISDVDFHTADENCACETYYPSYSRQCSYDNNGTHVGTSVLDADVTQLGQGGETITYAGGADTGGFKDPSRVFIIWVKNFSG